MTILEKAYALRQKVALADNLDYALNVAWGSDKEAAMANMRHLANRAIETLTSPRFESLDYDVRQASYNEFDRLLEAELVKFPDYNQENQEEHARHL